MLSIARSWRHWWRLAIAALVIADIQFAQNSPSREYIRLGGRVVAIESPNGFTLTLRATGASGVTATYSSSACSPPTSTTSGSGTIQTTCPAGTVVTITASNPPTGAQFNGWTGGTVASSSSLSTTVTLTANTELNATYGAPSFTLTIRTAGLSGMTATFSQAACSPATGTSSGGTAVTATCPPGTVVALTASGPSNGYQFNGWTGGTVANSTSLTAATVTMNSNADLTAGYGVANTIPITLATQVDNQPATLTIVVDNAPQGQQGIVNWVPGSTHTLRADPITIGQTRYVFDRWENNSTTNTRSVTPSVATTYTAYFRTQYRVTMAANPQAGGSTTPPYTQETWVNRGGSLTITATPNPGYSFAGWTGSGTGAFSGPQPTATIVVNNPITQTANFSQSAPVITPMFAAVRAGQQVTFTSPSPGVTWSIGRANGGPFTPGVFNDGTYQEGTAGSATTFTYTAPTFVSTNHFFKVRATNSAGFTEAELHLFTSNNTPATSAQTVPAGQGGGASGRFAIIYQDGDGYGDIPWFQAMFDRNIANPPATFANTCYMQGVPDLGLLYLAADNGAQWLTSGSMGENAILSNGQCTISLAGSSVGPIAPTPGAPTGILQFMLQVDAFKQPLAGSGYLHSYVQDRAGASYGWQSVHAWNVPSGDVQAPVITMVQHATSGTTATVTWNTNENATTQLSYGLTPAANSATTELNSTLSSSHSVVLTGLAPNLGYYYKVRSKDAAGNESELPGGPFYTGTPASAMPGLHATGVSNAGTTLAGGVDDPHYALVSSAMAGTGPQAKVVNTPFWMYWFANTSTSKWIGPIANFQDNVYAGSPSQGLYTYRTTFDLAGLDPATAVLNGQYASDDAVEVRLNGATKATENWHNTLRPFTINSGFTQGTNTLDFVVSNSWTYPNPSGLRVEMSGTANPGGGSNGGGTTVEYFGPLPMEAYTSQTVSSGTQWVGTRIQVGSSAVNVTQLGRWKVAGNTQTHKVAIFTYTGSTGVFNKVAETTVNMANGAAGQFVYAPLNYQLQPGVDYWIASEEMAGGDTHLRTTWTTVPSTTAIATLGCSVWSPTTGEMYFNPDWGIKLPYGPINFKYTTGTTQSPLSSITPTGSMNSGQTIQGSVVLSAAAQGNTTVSLGASGPVSVPASATVLNGQLSATFNITANSVAATTNAVITGTLAGASRTTTITVNPPPPPAPPTLSSITTTTQLVSGQSENATVTLTGPAQADTVVTISTSGPVSAPSTVTVLNGQTSRTFTITGGTVSSTTNATITGTLASVAKSTSLTVTSSGIPFFGVAPAGVYTTRSDITGWWGTRIVVGASPIPVKFLGRMKLAGNSRTHRIGIFTAWNNTTPVAEVTVDLANGQVGEYVYGAVNYTLQAGTEYWIASQETAGLDSWYSTSSAAEPTTTNVAIVACGVWSNGINGSSFNPDWGVKLPYGPVNFKY